MAILDLFPRPDFFPPCILPYKLKKILNKKSFTLLFHGESVKHESARTKKMQGGGAPNASSLVCLGLNNESLEITSTYGFH